MNTNHIKGKGRLSAQELRILSGKKMSFNPGASGYDKFTSKSLGKTRAERLQRKHRIVPDDYPLSKK